MPLLSTGFAWPGGVFYEGGGAVASDVVPASYPVAIAGHAYNIEESLYRLTHVPLRRPAEDQTAEPGEQTLSPMGLWRRSQSDWALGQGQLWLDEEESVRRRCRTSLGIDLFNDREIALLPAVGEKRTSANTNLKLLEVGTRVYAMDGDTLIFSDGIDSEQDTTWTVGSGWTAATGLTAGALLDMVYSGAHVYVLASDNNIFRATPGTVAFNPVWFNPATVYTRIFTGLGWLFATAANVLYSISAVPAEATVFTHPFADFRISALVGTPSGIYFAGNIGSNGEIRRMVVNSAGTGFDPPVVIAEFPNEEIFSLRAVGAHLAIGTSVGIRYAPIDLGAAGLDFGPAIEVGAVRDLAVEAVINPDGKLDTFVWFTWPLINGTSNSGLGRLRLTRFTEPNVPAYASDIYSAGGGTPLTVASIGGRRYFGISADGFYGATPNFVEEGELRTGRIRYGVLDTKVFNDVSWRTAPINGEVMVEAEFDDGNVTHVGDQTAIDTVGGHGHLGPVFAEWCELIFTLTRGGEVTSALHFSSNQGSASTPDHANFAITDLDMEWTGALENWVPGGANKVLMGQTQILGTIAWAVFIDSTGKIGVTTSPDGTAANSISQLTTTVPDLALGSEHTIGVQVDVNNGAGGRTYNFLIDGALFETITQSGTTSIFNSTDVLSVGEAIAGLSPSGYCLSAVLRASIGGADVANPDFSIQPVGTTSFADTAGTPKTWTINSPSTIALIHAAEDLTPRFRWWIMRAIPATEETMQILVPVRLYEKEQTPLGPAKTVAYLEEVMFLMNLANTKQVVTYQEGLASYAVYVNNIEVNPDLWNTMDHNFEGICMVELHTVNHP